MAKVKRIVSRRHARYNNLGKAPKVLGKDFYPNEIVGAARKVTIFVHVFSGGVDDRVFLPKVK